MRQSKFVLWFEKHFPNLVEKSIREKAIYLKLSPYILNEAFKTGGYNELCKVIKYLIDIKLHNNIPKKYINLNNPNNFLS